MRACGGCAKMVEDDKDGRVVNSDTGHLHVCSPAMTQGLPDPLSTLRAIHGYPGIREYMGTLLHDALGKMLSDDAALAARAVAPPSELTRYYVQSDGRLVSTNYDIPNEKPRAVYLAKDVDPLLAALRAASPGLRDEKSEAVVTAARALVDQFERMKKRQDDLLVHGQTFESASRNWDEHPEAFSEHTIDFQPLIDALRGAPLPAQTPPTETKDN